MSTFMFENTNSTILYIIGALGGDCVLGGECLRHPQGQCIFHCYAWFGGKLTKKIPKVAVKSYLCINIHCKFTKEYQYKNMPHFNNKIDETILVRSN